jgi:hypothetical protein
VAIADEGGQDGAEVKRNWRRTSFKRLDGSIDVAPDDWTLFDDNGRPLARIYHYSFGPNAGRWSGFILVARRMARLPTAGAGIAETGTGAREICERVLPLGMA